MNTIKGFALNRTFIDNNPGVVANIGELAPMGFTYAKEPRVYSTPAYPTLSLVHFPTKDSEVGFDSPIPDDQRDHILKVSDSVYRKSMSSNNVIPPGDFVTQLQSDMGPSITNIKVGGSVVYKGRSIIEWVEWTNLNVPAGNTNKLWFSNNSFMGQFDEYEIIVIPPIEPNQFFGHAEDVKPLLKARNYQEQLEMIAEHRGKSSETVLWGKEYNYVNPLNQNDKTPAKFSCLIYGAAGNNIDIIKEAIVQHLLDNSDYTRDQWKKILPELFLRTEFLIFPQYDRIAIENIVGAVNAVYSPIVGLTKVLDDLVANNPDYNELHIRRHAEELAFPYMSVALVAIGHVENRDEKKKLSDWFKDYFFTPNTSPDFERMSKYTQNWVLLLLQMLPIARDMTSGSIVPIGFSRVNRGDNWFLSKSYDDIQFLIAAPKP